jgi:Rhodopirellula transposase DDE domain
MTVLIFDARPGGRWTGNDDDPVPDEAVFTTKPRRALTTRPGRPAVGSPCRFFLAPMDDNTRGDPCSPLRWTVKSARRLAGELTAAARRCSPQTVTRQPHAEGFSLRANSKVLDGCPHRDRDAQFRYISGQAEAHMADGQPMIGVHNRKRELVDTFGNARRDWRPAGDPVRVRHHNFLDPELGVMIRYGIYDVAADTGFVNAGTDHDTAGFAVESIRRWCDAAGRDT